MVESEEVFSVGKLVRTENGAIWTIAKNKVNKIKKSGAGAIFRSDEAFHTDSGFWFCLCLLHEQGGEHGEVTLVCLDEVTVKLECIVIIQQERGRRENWVKISGFSPDSPQPVLKVHQLYSDTLVVEVKVRSCEVDTAADAYSVSFTETIIKAEEAKPWSLERALEYLGEETTKEKTKKTKTTKKQKSTMKLQKNKTIKKEIMSTANEESSNQEDPAKEKETYREVEESLKMKPTMEEEEAEAIKAELSQTMEEVEKLVEEQKRSKRKEEQLRGHLEEEVRSRERWEKELMEQVAEEEGKGRQFEEMLRKLARKAQAFPNLVEDVTKPRTGNTKEEEEQPSVVPSSRHTVK